MLSFSWALRRSSGICVTQWRFSSCECLDSGDLADAEIVVDCSHFPGTKATFKAHKMILAVQNGHVLRRLRQGRPRSHHRLARGRHQRPLEHVRRPLFGSVSLSADVEIVVDCSHFPGTKATFKAHKMILAVQNGVFMAVFYGDFAKEDRVVITDLHAEGIRGLLRPLFGSVSLSADVEIVVDCSHFPGTKATFKAHKMILAVQNGVFMAVFYGDFAKEDRVVITDCTRKASEAS
ncbi:hypothetical protein MTO96_002345 [Rhipicephalus appendiculatus]